jgi:hypothetical protein
MLVSCQMIPAFADGAGGDAAVSFETIVSDIVGAEMNGELGLQHHEFTNALLKLVLILPLQKQPLMRRQLMDQ